ncbi:MAG TPA: FmdB family zinc ribbon protein [Spirochaetia bacterium]|nr:FmdB family zinc ribbon protein [Spirochaetia bacterium]
MPTYEYRCTKGHTFEAFQSIKDEPLSRCPVCKSAVKRVINGGMGVIFKGSGFYTTDYKKSSALTGANGSSGKDKEKGSEKSGESTGSSEKGSSGKSSSEKSSSEKPKEKAAAS